MQILFVMVRKVIGINRYIVGCKFVYPYSLVSNFMELIDTQWDVNVSEFKKVNITGKELIDTQWDVNKGTLEREAGIKTELIDTQWDVNYTTQFAFS